MRRSGCRARRWQLNERHAAGEEGKRIQTQLLATQNERETMQTEIERLQAISGGLEQSVTQRNEAAARAAESAQAFAAWKKNLRSQLTAADYQWSDDSPFVRIPKSVLFELSRTSQADPFSPPGLVVPYARELMGLTPAECQSVEELLHRHFAEVEGKIEAGIYETNKPLSGSMVANREFGYSMPGDRNEVKQLTDQLLAEVRGVLGEERWPLVQARRPQSGGTVYSGNRDHLAGILEENNSGNLEVKVNTDDKGMLTVDAGFSGGIVGYVSGALSQFLPEGDPNRTEGSISDILGKVGLPEVLRRRALTWLQEQAIARLGKGASR